MNINIEGKKGFLLCSSKRFREFSKKTPLAWLTTGWWSMAAYEIVIESLSRYSIDRADAKKMMGDGDALSP